MECLLLSCLCSLMKSLSWAWPLPDTSHSKLLPTPNTDVIGSKPWKLTLIVSLAAHWATGNYSALRPSERTSLAEACRQHFRRQVSLFLTTPHSNLLFGNGSPWLRQDPGATTWIQHESGGVALLWQPCFVVVMSRKWGCDKAKSTSCVSKVNYYSRDSHFLFVLVLISPHSWCVLPSGPPLIKPFSCSKLDDPSPRFLPSLHTLTPTAAPVPSSSKPSHLTCLAANRLRVFQQR